MYPERYFLIILLLLYIGCSDDSNKSIKEEADTNEGLTTYLLQSKDASKPIEDRLNYVNNGFYTYLKERPIDSLHLAVITEKANLHYKSAQYDSAFLYDKMLLRRSDFSSHHTFAGKAAFNLALYYKKKNIIDSAFYYYNVSKNHFEKVRDTQQIGRRLLSMAIIQQNAGDFFGSKETVTEALLYLEKAKDKKYIASAFSVLGTNQRKLFAPKEAEQYYKRAIKKTESEKDRELYSNNLAVNYIEEGNYLSALELLKKTMATGAIKKDTLAYARALDNWGYCRWRLSGGNFEKELLEALEMRKQLEDQRGAIASYAHLSEYYSKSNPARALNFISKGIKAAQQTGSLRGELEALSRLIRLSPKNNAIKDRYIHVQDSLFKLSLQVKSQFAKIKFDYLREKQQIVFLEAETVKKNAALQTEKNRKLVYLFLLGLFLLVAAFLFFYMRERGKQQQLAAVYATEQKISHRLHDEISNDLYGVLMKMQHSNDGSKAVLNDLDHIYNRIRRISHDTNTIDTGEGFEMELKSLLTTFNSKETRILVKGFQKINVQRIRLHHRITLYRTLQEVLVNVRKHGKAKNILVQFEQRKKEIQVTCSDNGVGSTPGRKRGIGLGNIENRIRAVGGSYKFVSKQGKGTHVTITLPSK